MKASAVGVRVTDKSHPLAASDKRAPLASVPPPSGGQDKAGEKSSGEKGSDKQAGSARKATLLQDPFLNTLRREHVPVSLYLVNGIKLQGQIESFDQFVILLRNTVTQMVYKHAISTIVPGRAVNFQAGEADAS